MSRQLIISTIATLFCGGTIAFAHSSESQSSDSNRYKTIHTVILVAEDIDEYLDASDEDYPAFPNENIAPADEFDLSGIDTAKVFDLSQASWFLQYDANQRDDSLTTQAESPLAEYRSEINLHVEELIAMPTSESLRESRPDATNPFDWPARVGETLVDLQQLGNSESTAPTPLIVANPRPASNRAETAGLWVFLAVMIAPFAWLGWSEYKDLRARTQRAELEDAELASEYASSDEEVAPASDEPCATERRIMAAQQQQTSEADEQEEIDFTEITNESVVEDDCEYELGILDEANSLLASVGGVRSGTDEQPIADETPSIIKNEAIGGDEDNDLTLLRGIGPSTRDFLVSKGIRNLNDLLEADVDGVQQLLDDAGKRFQAARPEKWIAQARGMLSNAR